MASNNQPPQPSQNVQVSLVNLPSYHGTLAPKNPNIRRRIAQREKKALAAKSVGSAIQSTSGPVNQTISSTSSSQGANAQRYGIRSQVPTESQGAEYGGYGIRSQAPAEARAVVQPVNAKLQAEIRQQVRSQNQGILRSQLDDSTSTSRASDSPSPQHKRKPKLTARTTSAEIVEALMPDCSAPVSFPRRTASVRSSYEVKRPFVEFAQTCHLENQEREAYETSVL
jgi:hypothetical protein